MIVNQLIHLLYTFLEYFINSALFIFLDFFLSFFSFRSKTVFGRQQFQRLSPAALEIKLM